jgi:alpha-tubulin suppressor-like RCC1 family protein
MPSPQRVVLLPAVLLLALIGQGPAPTKPLVFTTVAAGGNHSCAITTDSLAYCWGANESGQLGTGSVTSHHTPHPVAGAVRFAALSAGNDFTCGVTAEAAVYCWGRNDRGQLGGHVGRRSLEPVLVGGGVAAQALSAGTEHVCVVSGGRVRCWGANAWGQLGMGDTSAAAGPRPAVAGITTAVDVSAGSRHSCALMADGEIYCWGRNRDGQLGDGTRTDRFTAVRVESPKRFLAVSAGAQHTCAITTTDAVWCWGDNFQRQLGPTRRERSTVPDRGGSDLAASISAGDWHTCAVLKRQGLVSASCWGLGLEGQLGGGGIGGQAMVGEMRFTQVSAGTAHSCGVDRQGVVYCWGRNREGQLGDGSRTRLGRPVSVRTEP